MPQVSVWFFPGHSLREIIKSFSLCSLLFEYEKIRIITPYNIDFYVSISILTYILIYFYIRCNAHCESSGESAIFADNTGALPVCAALQKYRSTQCGRQSICVANLLLVWPWYWLTSLSNYTIYIVTSAVCVSSRENKGRYI